jgi:hypothetical protein
MSKYCQNSSVVDPDPVWSGPFWSDPDPGLNKWLDISFFGVFKSHQYLRNQCCLTFWFMKVLFRAYFHQKKIFQTKVGRKFFSVRIRIRIRTFLKVGSGRFRKSDPDVFESRIRIRSKIVRIHNTVKRKEERLVEFWQIAVVECYTYMLLRKTKILQQFKDQLQYAKGLNCRRSLTEYCILLNSCYCRRWKRSCSVFKTWFWRNYGFGYRTLFFLHNYVSESYKAAKSYFLLKILFSSMSSSK